MRRHTKTDISPGLPIKYERKPPGAVIGVNAIILEVIGQVPTHLWHWSPWIGQQLPIAYLLWKIAQERELRLRLVEAWNSRFEEKRRPQDSYTADDILKRFEKPDGHQP